MPTDNRTIFEKLFDKSSDELKKIEEGSAAPAPAAPKAKASAKEREKERRIRERIRMFNEGKDPDAKGQTGLLNEGEFDEFALVGDPMLHHLQGDTQASPAEERQLMEVVKGATDFIFGDKMHVVVKALRGPVGPQEDPLPAAELYKTVSNTAFAILNREHTRIAEAGNKPEPAVFFAETGAVPIVVDALWDLSRQLQLPGSDDQDQYAGAIINVMKMAGEHVAASGDEEAIAEAEDLATTMALTKSDGTMIEELGVGPKVEQEQFKQKALAGSISTALLGSTV